MKENVFMTIIFLTYLMISYIFYTFLFKVKKMMFLLVSLIYLTLTVFYFDFVNFLAVWFNENGIRFQFGHVNEDIVFALFLHC